MAARTGFLSTMTILSDASMASLGCLQAPCQHVVESIFVMIFNQMMQLRIDAQIAGKNVVGVKRASSAQPSCRGQHTAIRRAGRIAAVGRIATVVEDAR